MLIGPLLARALVGFGPLSSDALAAWSERTKERRFDPHSFLLRAGERAEWCFLLISGLVREYYVDESGAEHTRSFIPEGGATGSLLDLLSGEPALTFIEALEPTHVLAFRYSDFDALSQRFADIGHIARRNAEALYARKARREHEMLALGASARHERWLAENAALDARITRRQLASHLGVTPEHLSRLRQQAASRQGAAPSSRKPSPAGRAR
jgi:CRP-like cAMP-binding protein